MTVFSFLNTDTYYIDPVEDIKSSSSSARRRRLSKRDSRRSEDEDTSHTSSKGGSSFWRNVFEYKRNKCLNAIEELGPREEWTLTEHDKFKELIKKYPKTCRIYLFTLRESVGNKMSANRQSMWGKWGDSDKEASIFTGKCCICVQE